MDSNNINNPFSFVAEYDGDESAIFDIQIEDSLPFFPLRNMVLFPGVIMPVAIGRPNSIRVVHNALETGGLIAAAFQLKPEEEDPRFEDIYPIGIVARVVKIFEMPDNTTTALVQGLTPINIHGVTGRSSKLMAYVSPRHEDVEEMQNRTFAILSDTLRDRLLEYIQISDQISDEALVAVRNASGMKFFVNYVCSNLPVEVKVRMNLLNESSPIERATKLLKILAREMQYARIRSDIQRKTQADIDNQQREYFLQQQLRNIQDQLGSSSANDVNELRDKASKMLWNDSVRDTFEHELTKLERLNTQSPDYQVQYNYLQTMLQLPWGVFTADNLDLKNAERVLGRNHYGMKEVKERILEHLAVRQMNGNAVRSTIICLYGPPGVGKTSLCKSIATAMKRKYVRASLGGLHDEAEIRGHRRTYIGAMSGRIIKNLIKAGSANPVFVLDEIDKITEHTYNGDPASALLEVLDPEQNQAFHDNFLEVDFDLSKVMFIATANNVAAIPRPLLDRMELIEVNGYITEEKIEIAKRHLIPRVMENCGLAKHKEIKMSKDALEFLIENYTRESGVRGLEKELDRFFRKMVLSYERNMYFPATSIKKADVEAILGKPRYLRDSYQGNGFAGVVTGLAWTSVGGEILFIETSLSKGKQQKLTLTGNLGDVMKESAVLALEFIKAHAEQIGVDMRIFDNYHIHIHVPEGAVPKDGPSAGITMATSLVSALTQRKVRPNIAMTGEITLRGRVLPVGGIKEKILAAKRAGITDIILCAENHKDIEEIDAMYLKGLTFHYANNVLEVLNMALLDELVDKPMQFTFEDTQNDNKK